MVKILLASNNACKVAEIKALLKGYEIYAFGEILKPFEIEENGTSFKENALIKSRAVFCALSQEQKGEFITLSDDSGISVAALNGAPSIHSARFSAQKTDKANRSNSRLVWLYPKRFFAMLDFKSISSKNGKICSINSALTPIKSGLVSTQAQNTA